MNESRAAKLSEDLETKGYISVQLDLRSPLAEVVIELYGKSKQPRLPEVLRQCLTKLFFKSETVAGKQSLNGLAVAVGQEATVSSNNENE